MTEPHPWLWCLLRLATSPIARHLSGIGAVFFVMHSCILAFAATSPGFAQIGAWVGPFSLVVMPPVAALCAATGAPALAKAWLRLRLPADHPLRPILARAELPHDCPGLLGPGLSLFEAHTADILQRHVRGMDPTHRTLTLSDQSLLVRLPPTSPFFFLQAGKVATRKTRQSFLRGLVRTHPPLVALALSTARIRIQITHPPSAHARLQARHVGTHAHS